MEGLEAAGVVEQPGEALRALAGLEEALAEPVDPEPAELVELVAVVAAVRVAAEEPAAENAPGN